MATSRTPTDLISASEAARRVSVGKSTIVGALNKGDIEQHGTRKTGGPHPIRLVSLAEVKEWAKTHNRRKRIGPPPPDAPAPSDLLSMSEAGRACGRDASFVRRAIATGELKQWGTRATPTGGPPARLVSSAEIAALAATKPPPRKRREITFPRAAQSGVEQDASRPSPEPSPVTTTPSGLKSLEDILVELRLRMLEDDVFSIHIEESNCRVERRIIKEYKL